MQNKNTFQHKGFTLLEILIALFIFTIVSLLLMNALHNVMNAQSVTERNATRLQHLQLMLLLFSRDIEQAIDRPIWNAEGNEESAFFGSAHQLIFTHTGFANPLGTLARSSLQRTSYLWNENALWRKTWDVLDQASSSQPHSRTLITDVEQASFEYLDKNGRFHDHWPLESNKAESLPRAVKIHLTIANWGSLSQLYVIPAQVSQNLSAPAQS